MSNRDVVVIGASSGGVEALRRLVAELPADLPATVFVVIHLPEGASSVLPKILNRAGPLPAVHPEDGQEILPGHIYVAPPDHHLLVDAGRVVLARGPKENLHRPAVDPLFRSAAVDYGDRVVGVVLTGARNDGTAGLLAVKRRGGVAVVQDPEDAQMPFMPESALTYVDVDHVANLREMPGLLEHLVLEPLPDGEVIPLPKDMEREARVARGELRPPEDLAQTGGPSPFSCPECHGPLWEIQDEGLTRFRCRVGHALTFETMLDEQAGAIEDALYTALNTLQENAGISTRLAKSSRERGREGAAAHFESRADDARRKAEQIRRILLAGGPEGSIDLAPPEPHAGM